MNSPILNYQHQLLASQSLAISTKVLKTDQLVQATPHHQYPVGPDVAALLRLDPGTPAPGSRTKFGFPVELKSSVPGEERSTPISVRNFGSGFASASRSPVTAFEKVGSSFCVLVLH